MKSVYFTLVCFLFWLDGVGQKINYNATIDSVKTITAMPYDPELSGDEVFWNLTKGRAAILPYLIERITDTTSTDANVMYFGGVYTVGDICVIAIAEIIEGFMVIKIIESDSTVWDEKGYGVYWQYVREDYRNRVTLQRRVKDWYRKNKRHLVWQEDNRLYAVSDDMENESKKRPAGGYYIIRK